MGAKNTLKKIRENRLKLEGCACHNFGTVACPFSIMDKLTCKECGGVARITDIMAYRRGYAAAGKPENDILVIEGNHLSRTYKKE